MVYVTLLNVMQVPDYTPRVRHYTVHPIGLNDFTTEWLHEFLLIGLWSVNYFGELNCIDYVASICKR